MTLSSALSPNLDLAQNSLSPALSRHVGSCTTSLVFLQFVSPRAILLRRDLACHFVYFVSHFVFPCRISSPNQRLCLTFSLSLSPASVLSCTVSSNRSCHEMTLYPTLDLSHCVIALFHFDPILVPQEAVCILLSTGIALPGACCWLPFCRKSRRRSPGSNLGWLHSSRLASILQLTHLATDFSICAHS